MDACNAIYHHSPNRQRPDLSDEVAYAVDMFLYVLLAISTATLLVSVCVLGWQWMREYDGELLDDEIGYGEEERLVPKDYADPEGYGAVGMRITSTSLIRKAWTTDGTEVDYLSD
ncbi:hypothetical protein M406DRAFT_70048 [Cryphonectria parasitica EP155]|uniref:Uncharacterized protein n=1 Tax=Cryphonectria parasitica (strain ATCC 38755 / EP155) TaxID=660469 RepID=A0A9P5CQW7_CRYP1|nr:uncharacterized protein M406DRAFT_70048 [Cryphonectria parasitica EP155]KAF3767944.1 hypothetical protein M406DRAFT_70048 [Cryphonectria parasitica EP155]